MKRPTLKKKASKRRLSSAPPPPTESTVPESTDGSTLPESSGVNPSKSKTPVPRVLDSDDEVCVVNVYACSVCM